MIYATLLKSTVPNRRDCREVESLIISYLDATYGQMHKQVRAACMINLLIHLQYEMGFMPKSSLIEKLSDMTRRFKDYGKVLEVRIMYPILKEQIARFNIMSRTQCPRKFVYYNIVAASNFVGESAVDMKHHGMACYIIASKFYEFQNLHSWNLILEFVFYNLGGLYLGEKQYSNALYCLIKALNNSKMFDGESSEISAKTFKKVNKMIQQAKNGDNQKESEEVSSFIRQHLKCLKFKEFDVTTQDEMFYNLTLQNKKDKSAKNNLIGNSYVRKFLLLF